MLLVSSLATAQDVTVSSPDGKITFSVHNGEKLLYSISRGDRIIIAPSIMGF